MSKKSHDIGCCEVFDAVPKGMTHARDWAMESNRPRVEAREECCKDSGRSINEAETGLTLRQPL